MSFNPVHKCQVVSPRHREGEIVDQIMEDYNASLDNFWIAKAIGYHGLPLKSAWEGERGDGDLARLGVTKIDFSVYQSRQRSLNLQDRQKRCQLHRFIVRKAGLLFDRSLGDDISSSTTASSDLLFRISGKEGILLVELVIHLRIIALSLVLDELNSVPPMTFFVPGNKQARTERFFQVNII